jgi:hypothetical protein
MAEHMNRLIDPARRAEARIVGVLAYRAATDPLQVDSEMKARMLGTAERHC